MMPTGLDMPLKLMIVDDSNLIRRRIERSQQISRLEVVGSASNGREATTRDATVAPAAAARVVDAQARAGGRARASPVPMTPTRPPRWLPNHDVLGETATAGGPAAVSR